MSRELIKKVNEAALEKKAANGVVLDLRAKSDICDFQYICSAENEKQTQAIAENIEKLCKKDLATKPSAIEGMASGHWIVLDYGSLIVHVFHKSVREYYALEKIWPNTLIDSELLDSDL